MSFIERLKNTFLPKNLSMSITIGLVILVILISKLGVKKYRNNNGRISTYSNKSLSVF